MLRILAGNLGRTGLSVRGFRASWISQLGFLVRPSAGGLDVPRHRVRRKLLNLQHINGFDACITQMRGDGDKIESTCAELDFGRFLYIHNVGFRFVAPQMTKGSDYDFEIVYPDALVVAADAKCKLETAAIEPGGVKKSLRRTREQLPKDRPGIVFVKIPQRWIDDPDTAREMLGARIHGNHWPGGVRQILCLALDGRRRHGTAPACVPRVDERCVSISPGP